MREEFELRGYYPLKERDALALIDLDSFRLLNNEERQRDNGKNDVDPALDLRMETFARYLEEKYVRPHWPNATYNYYNVWDGVDKDNQGWHTDFMEGYDIFFLYYFDDASPDTGGNICFRYGKQEDEFYPQAGDLFLVSNQRGFWHKAGATTVQRRVASFNFNTNE
jgi:hypothetical protein